MSATRTQVYLTAEQRRRIDQVARTNGLTMAAVIRRALDAYLGDEPDHAIALAATFGVDPDASVPARDEWARG
jgi:predicted DNA-binding protein